MSSQQFVGKVSKGCVFTNPEGEIIMSKKSDKQKPAKTAKEKKQAKKDKKQKKGNPGVFNE